MNFLDKNGFRAALVIAVIFLAMPFMFPERVPVNVKGSAEDSSQPVKSKKFLTGVYDRIGNFYNFKKNKKSALDLTLEQLKNEAAAAAAEKKSADAAAQNSFEKAAEGASSSAGSDAGGSSFETGSSSSKLSFSAAALKASSKPKLSIGGKEYEVVKDLYGKDYAITGKGPVAVSSLLAKGGVLKYPSGKTVSSARVSAEAYNAGGGANPYSSLTASSKASGGSYKGGKRSGGVASTRKVSSGFSLSGGKSGGKKAIRKSSGARGDFGDFTGAVDIEDAYNNVQSQAVAVKAMQQADSLEDSYTYYDAAAPASASARMAPSAFALPVNSDLIKSEPVFGDDAVKAAPDTEKVTVAAPVKKTNKAPDLNMDEALTAIPEAKEKVADKVEENVGEKKSISVSLDVKNAVGTIPGNGTVRKDMTKALLGTGAVFNSEKMADNNVIPDPWIVPSKIENDDFSFAFWKVNKEPLTKGESALSKSKEWKDADEYNKQKTMPLVEKAKEIAGPISVIVFDGKEQAAKDNYFQQMANYATGSSPLAPRTTKIYAVANPQDIPAVNSPYVFAYSGVITPDNNKKFFNQILNQANMIQKKKIEIKNNGGVEKASANIAAVAVNGISTFGKDVKTQIDLPSSKRPIPN
jgi:hypothetical protein